MFTKRDERGVRAFDDLAAGLETGTISRGKAIKLGGAALAASALGLFTSRAAEAQVTPDVQTAINKKKCKNQGGDWCQKSGCKACCGKDNDGGGGGNKKKKKACCGSNGCRCCKKNQRCDDGQCR